MTNADLDELERVARGLYAAFWARNGGGEPSWDEQADAIRKMWTGIAGDSLTLIAAARPAELDYGDSIAVNDLAKFVADLGATEMPNYAAQDTGFPAGHYRAFHRLLAAPAARPAVVSDEVASAMCHTFWREWENGGQDSIPAMRAALALLPGGVPDGYVLVPREPTREMWAASGDAVVALGSCHHDAISGGVWSAMLSASTKEVRPASRALGGES